MTRAMIAFVLAMGATLPALSAGKCPKDPHPQETLTAFQTQVFAALESEDRASWESRTSPDLTVFEAGHQYDRTGIFDLVKAAHDSGKHFERTLTEVRSESDCTVATLFYVLRGSVNSAEGHSPVAWLETATFRYRAGGWKLVFLASMREAS